MIAAVKLSINRLGFVDLSSLFLQRVAGFLYKAELMT